MKPTPKRLRRGYKQIGHEDMEESELFDLLKEIDDAIEEVYNEY